MAKLTFLGAAGCVTGSKYLVEAAGKKLLRLETGTEQAAAIGLYEGFSFRPCSAFGHYAMLPPHRIAASLFYEKAL